MIIFTVIDEPHMDAGQVEVEIGKRLRLGDLEGVAIANRRLLTLEILGDRWSNKFRLCNQNIVQLYVWA